MRLAIAVLLFLISLFSNAVTASYDKECIYVAARNGLYLRESPDPTGKIIEKLPYGTKLQWTPPGNTPKNYVIDNGKKVDGTWVRVERSLAYDQLRKAVSGYVFSAYLTYHLDSIPQSSLLLFDELYYTSANHTISARYEIDEHEYNYSAYIDCYPRYETHRENLILTNTSNPYSFLSSKIELRLIDQDSMLLQSRKLITGYEIDSSYQPKRIKQHLDDVLYDFKLPLKNGDSLLIQAHRGEFEYQETYVGAIPNHSMYVVASYFEGVEYAIYSSLDGSLISSDLPFYSPSSLYNVRLDTPYLGYGTSMSISYCDTSMNVTARLQVQFQSWVVDPDLTSMFWIGEHQLVFRAHPVDNSLQVVEMDEAISPHWQYVLLDIKP